MNQVAIGALLNQKIGLNPHAIGYASIAKAVSHRMAVCDLTDTNIYLARLQTSAQELEELIEAVIIPETWFFRDREPFVVLSHYAIAQWFPSHPKGVLRVLSLPCATGEEPYSIAIALIEAGLSPKNFCIDAVDISKKSLMKAQQALYSKNSFRDYTSTLPYLARTQNDSLLGYKFRERYFIQKGKQYQLQDWIRSTVNFIHGNLLDPYFLIDKSPYDVILCRNLLIYLDSSAKQQALQVLQRLLTNNGLLFVGHSETGLFLTPQFFPVQHPFAFAYRKLDDRSQTLGIRNQVNFERQSFNLPYSTPNSFRASTPTLRLRQSLPYPLRTCHANGNSFAAEGIGTPAANQSSNLQPEIQNLGQASAIVNERPKIRNSQTPILETAQRLADRGQLNEAATLCETYLSENRTSVEAYVLLGQVHQARGNEEQAEQSFHKAIYLEPNHYEALIHLALLKEHRGDLKNAALIRQRIQRLQEF